MSTSQERRTGDTVIVEGDYQHRAISEGSAAQRFWHTTKKMAIAEFALPSKEHRVLDVGCGSGVISDYLGSFGATVLGVDGSERAIDYATETFSAPNVSFELGQVDANFDSRDDLDGIYCLEVIEHIHEHQGVEMLRNFHSRLKDGGRVFLTTPNYNSLWPFIEFVMDRLSAAPKMDGDQHVMHYTKARLRGVCGQAGLRVITLTTMCFIAPWVAPISWSLATKLHHVETKLPLALGSILVLVAEKDGTHSNNNE